MAAPNLVFYYSLNGATAETFSASSSTIETYIGDLFADISLSQKIGKFTIDWTIYENNTQVAPGLYAATGSQTFWLPQGTITISATTPLVKNSSGLFSYPPGQQLVLEITAGSGDFLNAGGFVVINTDANLNRIVLVYFNK